MNSASSGPNYGLLRTALFANAGFSLVSGCTLTFLGATIAPLCGENVSVPLVMSIGAALVPFGVFTAWIATRRHPPMLPVLLISFADLLWVAGSVVLLVLGSDALSGTGLGLVSMVTLAVLGFALGQLRGIARVYRPRTDAPRQIRVCIEVRTPGSAETVWRNVADMGNIARFAPLLATSGMRDDEPARVGAVRVCRDRAQRHWAERCVRLDAAARELDVEFLAAEPGFPFPFQSLQGGWRVRDEPGGAAVTIWWEGTVHHAILAGVLPALLAWQAQRQFAVVVARMAATDSPTPTAGSTLLSVVPC
jgi:hypothetical protein